MKSLKEIISEGFVIDRNIVYFDPKQPGFINTKFGKFKAMKPYEGKLSNGRFYAAYTKEKNLDKLMYDEVLRAIKGSSSKLVLDSKSYKEFLNRTAIYLSRIILKEEVDTIIMMDSKSNLVKDLTTEMNSKLPKYFQIHSFENVIYKNPNIEEIFIDTGDINLGSRMKGLQKDFDRIKKSGAFNMKEIKQPQTRKFIKDWLKIRDGFQKHIFDKNVCLVDDYVTSGATMDSASEILSNMGAKKVVGLAILKGN